MKCACSLASEDVSSYLRSPLLRALRKLVRSLMASSAYSCLYRLDRSNMLSTCRRAAGRRRLAAKRRKTSSLQTVSGNTASGWLCVRAIVLEVLCLQHICWITAHEFSRSTKLLRIRCWYIESLSDPGCELCLSADVRTLLPHKSQPQQARLAVLC